MLDKETLKGDGYNDHLTLRARLFLFLVSGFIVYLYVDHNNNHNNNTMKGLCNDGWRNGRISSKSN
jgi:hypothetical protein